MLVPSFFWNFIAYIITVYKLFKLFVSLYQIWYDIFVHLSSVSQSDMEKQRFFLEQFGWHHGTLVLWICHMICAVGNHPNLSLFFGFYTSSFSNRCFWTKAISIWTSTSDAEHVLIVGAYFHYAGGFEPPQVTSLHYLLLFIGIIMKLWSFFLLVETYFP